MHKLIFEAIKTIKQKYILDAPARVFFAPSIWKGYQVMTKVRSPTCRALMKQLLKKYDMFIIFFHVLIPPPPLRIKHSKNMTSSLILPCADTPPPLE